MHSFLSAKDISGNYDISIIGKRGFQTTEQYSNRDFIYTF